MHRQQCLLFLLMGCHSLLECYQPASLYVVLQLVYFCCSWGGGKGDFLPCTTVLHRSLGGQDARRSLSSWDLWRPPGDWEFSCNISAGYVAKAAWHFALILPLGGALKKSHERCCFWPTTLKISLWSKERGVTMWSPLLAPGSKYHHSLWWCLYNSQERHWEYWLEKSSRSALNTMLTHLCSGGCVFPSCVSDTESFPHS